MSHCVFTSPYNTLQVYRLPVANISPKENEVVWWWGGGYTCFFNIVLSKYFQNKGADFAPVIVFMSSCCRL